MSVFCLSDVLLKCRKPSIGMRVSCVIIIIRAFNFTATLDTVRAHLPSPRIGKPSIDLFLSYTALMSQELLGLGSRIWIVLVDV